MNDQIRPQEQKDTPPAGAEGANARLIGRRRLAKLALGTPVVMTLASRPVLAGPCLSNMMSGHMYQSRGSCSKGWSPGGWGAPRGKVHIYTTVGAWALVFPGIGYGTFDENSCPTVNNPKDTKYECYVDGATIDNVPLALNKDGVLSGTPLRELLMDENGTRQLTRHLVCAYMNALLSVVPGSTFTYILRPEDVEALAVPGAQIPGNIDLQTFLGSTWN